MERVVLFSKVFLISFNLVTTIPAIIHEAPVWIFQLVFSWKHIIMSIWLLSVVEVLWAVNHRKTGSLIMVYWSLLVPSPWNSQHIPLIVLLDGAIILFRIYSIPSTEATDLTPNTLSAVLNCTREKLIFHFDCLFPKASEEFEILCHVVLKAPCAIANVLLLHI